MTKAINCEYIYKSLLPPRRVHGGGPPRSGNEEYGGCGSCGTAIDEDEAPIVGVELWNLGSKGPDGGGISTRSSSSWIRAPSKLL